METIGHHAFYCCRKISEIIIPGTVTTIEAGAFCCCYNLRNVYIKDGVCSIIEEGAFQDCENLVDISLPDSLTTIGECAFANCPSLKTIQIPASVTSIGWNAFGTINNPRPLQSSGILAINVLDDNPIYASIDGVLFSKDLKTLICYPKAREGSYIVPQSVTEIGEYAFKGCTILKENDIV